ncbi:hypothetical protein CF327_g1271 [Tilletia walkeri]|uniref:Minor extracellular protease vpr n=1 Tax=Tilletia walkeri TaxID=117179 RepID=A0A8X7T7G9_9BASI|nr:hypothetical protein CF327_g1271 [Tilletia walkeri]KAE8270303.1 hypothetical protein A4X09_0g2020 [Tilletia walkeri]
MKLTLAFVALLQLVDGISARRGKPANAGPKALGSKNQPTVIPRGYLVEFVSDSARNSAQASGFSKREDRTQHDALHSFLTKRKSPVKFQTRFTFTDARIFSGMSLILDNDKDADELRVFPGVKKVHKLRNYKPAAFQPTIAGPEFVQSAVNGGDLAGSRVTADSFLRNDTFEPHVMTGVDKLHAQGYYGKGQTVGILDTGIDYTHPALNGGKPSGTPCFGTGCPVSGGYDFVGDRYDGIVRLNPIPDPDPFADCDGSGHGTHVAGTVIALDREVGFTGVVPQANVHAYRIFGCGEETSTSTDVIIAALEKGFFDGVDVLSLSLGGPSGWVEDPGSAVASRITDLGTPVIVAHGNDGADGAFYGSAPATGLGVTGVGSVDNKVLTGYSAKLTPSAGAPSDGNGNLVYLNGVPFTFNSTTGKKLKLYATSKDPNVMDDGCAPLPSSTPDLTNYVAVIARGTCTFVTKFTNAYNAGARYVFIYNSPASITYLPTPEQSDLQVAMLTRSDGQYIVNALAAGKQLSVDFSNQTVAGVQDTGNGGYMSSFSTYGLSWEAQNVAAVSAPGGNILSTWPLRLGKYAIISGTSMATPFISGSTAMYRSIKGTSDSPAVIRSVLATTADPLGFSINVTTLETTARQGGGLVNVYRAIKSVSRVSPGQLDLNDTQYFDGTQTLTIKNVGSKEQTYTLSHLPGGSIESLDTGDKAVYIPGPIKPTKNAATVKFSSKTVTILPGQSQDVSLTFKAPGLDTSTLPIYSGFIYIKSSASFGSLHVPYSGVATKMSQQQVLDTSDSALGFSVPALLKADAETVITDDKRVYSLKSSKSQPKLAWRLLTGTASYSIDLVDGNTTFVPTIPVSNAASNRRSVAEHRHAGIRRMSALELAHSMHAEQHRRLSVDDDASALERATATGGSFNDVKIIGNLESGTYLPRNTIYGSSAASNLYNLYNVTGNYTDSDGVDHKIQNGTYRILLRAKRLFALDATKESSYESYLTHAFTVKRA